MMKMAFNLNDMSGFLFKNEDHIGNRPTHKGSIKINGVEYWMSAWVKEGRNGKFFSMAFQEKEEKYQNQGGTGGADSNVNSNLNDFDDDIPF
jgi:hypothetical protein